MPLDFRYHLASLTAVFVALIIGILLGAAMTDAPTLKTQMDSLEKDYKQSRGLEKINQKLDKFNTRTLSLLVHNRLSGRNVILVQDAATFPDNLVDDVRSALEQAGATITAQVVLKPTLLLATPEQIARVFDRSKVSADDRKDTPDSLMRALGTDLGNGYYGMAPALDKEKLISATGDLEVSVSMVVLLSGGVDSAGMPARIMDLPLLQVCAERGLRVAAAETQTVPESDSAIPIYRKGNIPITVDNIDHAAGRIALVLALAENQRGNFGYKSTASDVVPDVGE